MNIELDNYEVALLDESLSLALSEIHNRVATCPDVDEYAIEIQDLEVKKGHIKELQEKITRS